MVISIFKANSGHLSLYHSISLWHSLIPFRIWKHLLYNVGISSLKSICYLNFPLSYNIFTSSRAYFRIVFSINSALTTVDTHMQKNDLTSTLSHTKIKSKWILNQKIKTTKYRRVFVTGFGNYFLITTLMHSSKLSLKTFALQRPLSRNGGKNPQSRRKCLKNMRLVRVWYQNKWASQVAPW